MSWVRTVTGIQLHQVTDLQDDCRFLANAHAALRAAHVRTGDARYAELRDEIAELAARVRELENEARARLESMDPGEFVRCREGEQPWPDEIADGFVPRHTCRDNCLYHDAGVLEAIMQCICGLECRACSTLS